jgi:hypothetical protein
VFAAQGTECERLIAAGLEFQRIRAAEACLKEIAFRASQLDDDAAAVVNAWSKSVSETLSRRDPIGELIEAVRMASAAKTKPLWWPTQ